MRKLLLLLAVLGTSSLASAEDVQEMFGMASYYQFKTDDAEALVPALTAYSGSECRKRVPAQIRLMSEHFNGDEEATHTVIYGLARQRTCRLPSRSKVLAPNLRDSGR